MNKPILLIPLVVLSTILSACNDFFDDWTTPTPVPPVHGDTDSDRMTQKEEAFLANSFAPVLIFDEEEDDCISDIRNHVGVIYQVTPLTRNGVIGALITYVFLYPQDCGVVSSSVGWEHNGDTEALRIYIQQYPDNSWSAIRILMRRHDDPWHASDAQDFNFQSYNNGPTSHSEIWVSESKHAMYRTKSGCESYGTLNWEDCGGGETVFFILDESSNAGERHDILFDKLSDSSSSLHQLFPNEFAWSDINFCGNRSRGDCAASISSKWWPPQDIEAYHKQIDMIFP